MSRLIIAGDLFCGAGGTSSGIARAVREMGAHVQLAAVNHWPVAVRTHAANHPEAVHHCLDISMARPEDVVPGGYLDLLCASPECVFFSRARGGKPVNDQRRSGAWWLLEWLARLDVRCLLVENVEEFLEWGPVLPSGTPDPAGKRRYFEAWVQALWGMGYVVDWKVLNAADFGDATTRRRLFVQARKDGRPIRWPEPTHSKTGGGDLFGTLPTWRAAREIIDWTDLGPSMLDRPKPLSLKTRLRIARGLQRFGGILAPLYIRLLDLPTDDEQRFIAGCADGPVRSFILGRFSSPQAFDVDNPAPTVVGRGAGYLVSPTAESFMLSRNGHNDPNGRTRPVSDPMATVTSSGSGTGYLTTPAAEPFVFANRNNAVPAGTDRPAPTFTTATGGGAYVVNPRAEPFVLGQQSDSAARDSAQPIPTISTAGVVRVFSPTAAPFLDVYYATGQADSVDEPLSTATTKPRHALVAPLVVKIDQTHQAGPGVRPANRPLPTLTTKQSEAVATPFAVPYYGERDGQAERVHDLAEPLPTVTTAGRFALVWPHLSPKFGERPGQDPRAHDIEAPLPTVTADGAGRLVSAVALPAGLADVDPRRLVVIDGVLHLLDIRFRMLKNGELAAAMGFPRDYQFHGTKGEVTKQIGNAVCVGVSAALVGAMLDDGADSTRRTA